MKLSKIACAVALGQLSLGAVMAHAGSAPTLKEVLGASGITVSGYVDAAYTHFDTDANAAGPNYFDSDASNTFRLKQAGLTLASQPTEGFGALLNLTAGTDATHIHSAGGSTSDVDVTQGFVQYTSGGLTVIGGKFNTLAGAEVISPTGNTNISRSVAFLNSLPFTHTGVRVSYAPTSAVTLYAGYNNGWDQVVDANKGKTAELGVSATFSDMLSGAVYAYSGGTGASPTQALSLVDVVVTIKPITPLAIVLNYDMDKQKNALPTGDAKWTAMNVYFNYQATDKLRTSLRLEQVKDTDGFKSGTVGNKISGTTLTVGYAVDPSFELRGEIRRDKSSDAKLYTKDGSATDKEQYFAVEGLYKF